MHMEDSLLRISGAYDFCACCVGKNWSAGALFAFGAEASTNDFSGTLLSRFSQLQSSYNDWIFGHAGYNLKVETENVDCCFPDEDGFAQLFFFVPKVIVWRTNGEWKIGTLRAEDKKTFCGKLTEVEVTLNFAEVKLTPATSAPQYMETSASLLQHIHRGDIYEINYCIDFTGKAAYLNPAVSFQRLHTLAEAPMAVLYRNNNSWLFCASPERYISKKGKIVRSQPIKGTKRRGTTAREDEELMRLLLHDEKERSENVMIVDLVRNDLSRIASKGSVKVSELFGVHTFKTVHQLISTVECTVDDTVTTEQILRATFPMGSMTGAPKISAMKLAEKHEAQSRGIYSGTVGFIAPNGDFDFNVVIRSIMWNADTGHISVKAGSAITANSIPEKEYEECHLKAEAMMNALNPARV